MVCNLHGINENNTLENSVALSHLQYWRRVFVYFDMIFLSKIISVCHIYPACYMSFQFDPT